MHLTRGHGLLMIPQVNSMTAYALGYELDRTLAGATVAGCNLYSGGFTLKLDGAPLPFWHALFFARDPEFFPSSRPIVPRAHSTEVMKPLSGKRIAGVRPLALDRIILFRMEGCATWGETSSFRLRLELAPARKTASLFRLPEERILGTAGQPRSRRPGSSLEKPPGKPYSLLSLPENPPDAILEGPEKTGFPESTPEHTRAWKRTGDVTELLLRSIDGLDPILARSLSRSAKGNLVQIWGKLRTIGGRLREKSWSWHLYDFPGEAMSTVYPVPIPLEARHTATGGFIETLGRRATGLILPSYIEFVRGTAISAARRELRRAERLKENLIGDLEEAERAKDYRHIGNLLVTHRNLIKPGMGEISVRDFSGDKTIRIELDPAGSPEDNIRRYFSKAKKGDKGIVIIRNRKHEADRAVRERRRFIERVSGMSTLDELLPLVTKKPRGGIRNEREEVRRFRSFSLDEAHTVYVGRNNRENDELTHRFASPRDIWLHAQGVGGSHAILKGATRSTPKRILEQAAAITAYFSKARHSATAPVVYTEKKYVRKPRKSPPGTATFQRGKTIFVKPALPEKEKRSKGGSTKGV